jgi:hypothetical protein
MIEDWSEVPAIPVYPNWASPYSVRYEFRTTVFESDTGDEQRRALRQRPRRSIQFTASPVGEPLRDLTSLLSLRRDTRILVPDVTQSVLTEYVDSTHVASPESPAWLEAGERVFLQEGRRSETATVVAVSSGEVEFSAPVAFEYTNPRISPARYCRFPATQKLSFPTNRVASTALSLEIDPGTEEDHNTGTSAQFRGVDTLFMRPNWRDGAAMTFGIPGDRIDYGVGRIFVDYRQVLNTKIMEFTYLAQNREKVERHLDLFYRCKGRRGVFYVPTWTSDFEVVGPVDLVNNEITVRGTYRQELDPFDFSHRNIALIWGDTVIPCGIYSVAPSVEGLKLRLDRDLSDLPIPSKFYVSWLVMARFASDELTVDWRTDTVAEISYNLAVLRESFREFAIAGHRIVLYGNYLLMGV